jgi:hypothetical protein
VTDQATTTTTATTTKEATMGIGFDLARGAVRAVEQGGRHAQMRQQCADRAAVLGRQLHAQVAVREPDAIIARPRKFPPIDGARLMTLVKMYLCEYVSFPDDASANLAAAWVLHAVARQRDDTGIGPLIWRASPRLLVTSKTRGSGKSTLLDLILILTQSRRGKIPNITPAKFAKVVGKYFETVCLDEAKTILGSGSKSLELQGVLLAGYTPRASYEVSNVSLPLFSAVAWAGKDELITETSGSQIGDLLDRSLTLRLRPPARPMPEIDEQAEDDGETLAALLVAWTDSRRGELIQAARDLAVEDRERALDGANLRAIQISRPLRACGRVAGGGWEDVITDSLEQLTEGAASAQLADAMADMERRAAAWQSAAGASAAGDDEDLDDAPGRIVEQPYDESEDED